MFIGEIKKEEEVITLYAHDDKNVTRKPLHIVYFADLRYNCCSGILRYEVVKRRLSKAAILCAILINDAVLKPSTQSN